MRTTPTFHLRDSLMLLGMYAIGLIPGAILDGLTPAGEHLSWLPLILGSVLGMGIGGGLGWLTRRLIHRSGYRDVVPIMLLMYSMAWTGPAVVRALNKGLDRSPAVAHTTTIVAVNRPSKGPNQIVVLDWRDPRKRITLVGSGTVGDEITVRSHRGWLGFAWIEGR